MAKTGRPTKWPDPKTNLASRLQSILPERGLENLSLNYFGGIAKETTRKYLSGEKEPPLKTLLELCKKGKVSPIYLIFGKGHPADIIDGIDSITDDDGPGKIIITDNVRSILGKHLKPNLTPNDFYEIPYFPDGVAAGNPREMSDYPDGIVILHKDWCPHPRDTSAARLSNTAHSMEPTIMAGSIITVDHSITDPEALRG